ncbi:hypothetical protein K504DRAFT_102767 [Pleomassaria siparia CBS 279.74]|uniref:Uncharacterized protein n=1 Tax=Pleomassaria siparia CBS 279.74 TaxID=1314801 RepID=A0A6G1JX48_9PLEO|nr:hypothetical protein K504DRAFT_102767 [Pleomassaria siparia CBS 279.74]
MRHGSLYTSIQFLADRDRHDIKEAVCKPGNDSATLFGFIRCPIYEACSGERIQFVCFKSLRATIPRYKLHMAARNHSIYSSDVSWGRTERSTNDTCNSAGTSTQASEQFARNVVKIWYPFVSRYAVFHCTVARRSTSKGTSPFDSLSIFLSGFPYPVEGVSMSSELNSTNRIYQQARGLNAWQSTEMAFWNLEVVLYTTRSQVLRTQKEFSKVSQRSRMQTSSSDFMYCSSMAITIGNLIAKCMPLSSSQVVPD